MRSAGRLQLAVAPLGLVVAVSGVALAVSLVGTTREVKAEADGWLLDSGAQALAFPGPQPEEPRFARLNGVEIAFRTQTVEASLIDVLEHFRKVCREPGSSASPLVESLSRFATRTAIGHDHGYVACLRLGVASLRSLAARFARFVQTGDLADLGGLRYAYAHRARTDAARTLLFTLWSDGSLPLGSLIPRAGLDSPGEDLPGVPRPEGATRLLSFHETAAPSRIAVYRNRGQAPADAAKVYRERLIADRWIPIGAAPTQLIELEQGLMFAAERGATMLTAVAHSDRNSGTLTTLLVSEAR
mgnify:FL=1